MQTLYRLYPVSISMDIIQEKMPPSLLMESPDRFGQHVPFLKPYIIEWQIQGFMRITISRFDMLQQKRSFSHPFRSKETDQPPVPLDLPG